MAFEIEIKQEALDDIRAAFFYYNQQAAGLGDRFLDFLEIRLQHLTAHPHNYSFIDEIPGKIFRDVRLEKFPYVIVYEITGLKVIVYAVHHTRRHPGKKLRK
jgi:toxin ParE1/3/4